MRSRLSPQLEMGRLAGDAGAPYGMFSVVCPDTNRRLNVMIGVGAGWDHVTVSVKEDRNATPTWAELDWVKRLAFKPEEVAMQLHVAVADHINVHPGVLHLWRPQFAEIPLPPKEMV